ncbi:5643_t:CDS:2 [Rhizophagus irregularis]|nr:5643_t:CDS:2 [Rhizophagus irregularis]
MGSSTTSKQKSKACWALHKSKIHQPDGGVIKESIKSAFQMNVLAENKKKEREKEIILDYFKIQMENQKCYSNLKLDEVLLNIYNRQTGMQNLESKKS